MSLVWVARDHNARAINNLGRRIPTSADRFCFVKFNLLAVIDICTECPLYRIDISAERIR